MVRRVLSAPLPLLLLFTGLCTFLIQSGELGTADTLHRLQVTHSLWTGQPQVFPWEYPEFGLHGRGGRIYAWFGIGQSLLMLPVDLVATAARQLPVWEDYVDSQTDPAIRSIIVSITMNIVLNVVTALVAFRFLRLLAFKEYESILGALSLLFATTHLHYAQNMQENNYIFLLTLLGMLLQLQWLYTGERKALFWGSMALGLNLLTRMTTALDVVASAGFLALTVSFCRRTIAASQKSGRCDITREGRFSPGPASPLVLPWKPLAVRYLRTAAPVYAVFFFLDRLYQWIRFGSWTNTYVTIFAREERQIDPSLPLKYPFSGSYFGGLHSGLIGPFFHPEKSVFLFDPLFGLTLIVVALLWKKFEPVIRAFLVTMFLLVAAYLVFYGRYFSWQGDFAWGDRYASSVFEMGTLLTWPLLLRSWDRTSRGLRAFAIGVTGISVIIQCASLAFWVPLEIYQEETFGHPTWVVFLRFKNIIAQALGRSAAWGLHTPAMFEDPWDAQHITTWNFLPSLLRHIGVAPMWAVHVLYGVWLILGAAAIFIGFRLTRTIRILAISG